MDSFYIDVLGRVKVWTAAPPRLREEVIVVVEPGTGDELISTSLSSQDDPDLSAPGEAPTDEQPEVSAPEFGVRVHESSEAPIDDSDETPAAWLVDHDDTSQETSTVDAPGEDQPSASPSAP